MTTTKLSCNISCNTVFNNVVFKCNYVYLQSQTPGPNCCLLPQERKIFDSNICMIFVLVFSFTKIIIYNLLRMLFQCWLFQYWLSYMANLRKKQLQDYRAGFRFRNIDEQVLPFCRGSWAVKFPYVTCITHTTACSCA